MNGPGSHKQNRGVEVASLGQQPTHPLILFLGRSGWVSGSQQGGAGPLQNSGCLSSTVSVQGTLCAGHLTGSARDRWL